MFFAIFCADDQDQDQQQQYQQQEIRPRQWNEKGGIIDDVDNTKRDTVLLRKRGLLGPYRNNDLVYSANAFALFLAHDDNDGGRIECNRV